MSLKAKIEAVIYAAEEPVTLAQLLGLLSGEAQRELDGIAAAQHELPLGSDATPAGIPLPSEPELLNGEVLDIEELLEAQEDTGQEDAQDARTGVAQIDEAAPPEMAATPGASPEAFAATPPSAERDEKQMLREAKERERAIRDHFRRVLDELVRDYAAGDRGLEIREVANGFRLATKPEYHDTVRGFARSLKPPLKLSLQALETLAVVAYKQPVTAPEVSEIRGVDSGGVLGSLMARKLVTTAGRKPVVGRPILYKTTKDFLLRFGLKDVGELPSIEEFEKMAGELAEGDAVQETMPMADRNREDDIVSDRDLREEENATEPQADGDSTDTAFAPQDEPGTEDGHEA